MKTLFVKHTFQRHENYRIITLIEKSDDGQVQVRKKPQTSLAASHVQSVFENFKRVEAMNSNIIAPKVYMKDGHLISEYIDGISYAKIIGDAVQQGSKRLILKTFDDYYQLLNSLPVVSACPSTNPKFAEVFSKTDRLFQCLQVGLIDLIPENIIIDRRGNHYHIDCEWVIDAPVPLAFVMFRAVVVIYNKFYRNLQHVLPLHDILTYFDLDSDVELFNTWESEFSERIHQSSDHYKNNYQIPAPTLGHWKDKKPHILGSSLYYSDDGNLSEEKKISKDVFLQDTYLEGSYTFREPTAIQMFRWDPCENYCVLVRDVEMHVSLKNKRIDDLPRMITNAIELESGVYLFLSNDPQFLFVFSEPVLADRVHIEASVQVLSYSDIMNSDDYLKTWRFGLAAFVKDLKEINTQQQAELHEAQLRENDLRADIQIAEEKIATERLEKMTLRNELDELIINTTKQIADLEQKGRLEKQSLMNEIDELIITTTTRISDLEQKERRLTSVSHNYMYEYQKKSAQLNALKKSPLYLVFEPLRYLKRQFVSIVRPLRVMRDIEAVPLRGIHAEAPGVFVTDSEDPQLLLLNNAKKGLYLFRWNGMASKHTMLKLYPIVAGDTSETESTRLGWLNPEAANRERFVYLRNRADILRIDPGEESGVEVIFSDINYRRLGPLASIRVGLALISRATGFKKWRLFIHYTKLIMTGKKGEAKQHFIEAFKSFGDGCHIPVSHDEAYANYIRWHEISESEVKTQRILSRDLSNRPTISVLAPIDIDDTHLVREMINSVRSQSYPNWELCVVGPESLSADVKSLISRYAETDVRIHVNYCEKALRSFYLNHALEMADGEFVMSIQTSDLLAPWALFEMVSHINEKSDVDLIYADEDRMSIDGMRRYQPLFKPDWSPDLLCSYNYIGNAYIVRKTIMLDIGGFRSHYDSQYQYDMLLRLTSSTEKIAHIPSIMYHSREEQLPQQLRNELHFGDSEVAVQVLQDHFNRIGREARVSYDQDNGVYHADYAIVGEPLISLIIPNYEHREDLEKCINSVLNLSTYRNFEIVIIENNSQSQDIFEYYEQVKTDERIRVIQWPEAFNYSAINNFGVSQARGEYVVLLNNDTEVIAPDWLQRLLGYAQRDDVGAVGARLLYSDHTIQHAGVIIGFRGVAGHAFAHLPSTEVGYMNRAVAAQNLSAVTAACLMMRKSLFEKIGGFEEKLAVAFNDIDLCLKIREQGYNIVYAPKAELYHHESLSRGEEDTDEKKARFSSEVTYCMDRWKRILTEGDPYYSPHLDLCRETYQISTE